MRSNVNRKGIQQLAYEPQMHRAMGELGQAVATIIRATAPINSGHYKANIEVRTMSFKWARTRVYARDFKAYWIEYGAGPSPVRGGRPYPAHHTMQNAVIAAGLRWDDRYAGSG